MTVYRLVIPDDDFARLGAELARAHHEEGVARQERNWARVERLVEYRRGLQAFADFIGPRQAKPWCDAVNAEFRRLKG